jgi:hypothetical protein
MSRISLEEFTAQALEDGYDEVIERNWPALTVLDSHTHPFALRALVMRGEMWLEAEDTLQHLNVGDTFELDRDVPHAERYGSEGATYWVARRN